MKSRTTDKFWKCYENLPQKIKRRAKVTYEMFCRDPWYPGLYFKRIHSSLPIYSARISIDYRAVGLLKDDAVIWFWIGSHADYDQLIHSMRNRRM